ncbi:ATP-binding protein [Alteromonadaceae bacterium BrNp21-10]|nr:ATP-binding protein [Alteromonadaceae bacterium BrNp21-10]
MKSIRQYLTLLLIASITLIAFSAAIQGYRSSMAMSSKLFDDELEAVALSLAFIDVDKPIPLIDTHNSLGMQIWLKQQLVLQSANTPTVAIAPFTEGFSEQNFSSQRWRVYSFSPTPQKWLMVAQPLNNRFAIAENMILAAMTPLIITIPLLAIVIYFSVSRGLLPLKALSEQLSHRQNNNLQPIHINNLPRELTSVVSTLNSLFKRLQSAFEREQQFAANAAHELRTPLSVLKIKLHNLQQQAGVQKPQVQELQQDTDRMIDVVNQMLQLSRTNPEFFNQHLSQVDLYEIAQQVISDLYKHIDKKQQQIELTGQSTIITSSEFTLHTLLQNLISNANKYTPDGGHIHVNIQRFDDYIELIVSDSGPGIDANERQQALQRFYRTSQTNSKIVGSGLGLAIVQQIVMLHQGNIVLEQADIGGLQVRISLPNLDTVDA